jgi:class 3 adenylate cyclase
LEKIKTIGDAYMAVAGAPLPQDDHALCAAHFALDVAETIREFRTPTNEQIDLRIGIHSGRLVAGIIGENKFAYDLWGDAVNMASRMESHGEAGRIHVSEEFVKELIVDSGQWIVPETLTTKNLSLVNCQLSVEARGEIEIKGKGLMRTYFLERDTS